MKRSTFGALVATAMSGLLGGAAAMAEHHEGDAKACYRSHCGKSVKGHEGKCGGTKVDGLDQKACEAAGGAWATAAEAAKYKKH